MFVLDDSCEKKQVRFENPPVTSEQTFERTPLRNDVMSDQNALEEWWAHTILLMLFVLCALCLCGVAASLYCRSWSSFAASPQCNAARAYFRHAWNVMGYYWHRFVMGE